MLVNEKNKSIICLLLTENLIFCTHHVVNQNTANRIHNKTEHTNPKPKKEYQQRGEVPHVWWQINQNEQYEQHIGNIADEISYFIES